MMPGGIAPTVSAVPEWASWARRRPNRSTPLKLSVANVTVADGHEFLDLAARSAIRTPVTSLPLEMANEALDRLRGGERSQGTGAGPVTSGRPIGILTNSRRRSQG